MSFYRSDPQNFSAHRKSEIFFRRTHKKTYSTMNTTAHGAPLEPVTRTDDDFSHFEREIARQRGQNPDSLNKRVKLTGTAHPTVTRAAPSIGKFGPHTQAAISEALNNAAVQGVGVTAMFFDECQPIGPSDWYLTNHPLPIGRIAFEPKPDLLYRPNERISLEQATEKLVSDRLAQVGGTHYGNPASDVYAFAMANALDPMQFNVVKYVTRFRKKDGIKDLRKAIQTLERLIAHEESK